MAEAKRDRKLVLGMDLGSSCGICFCYVDPSLDNPLSDPNLIFYPALLDLQPNSYESGAIRFTRLFAFLSDLKPDLIIAEQVALVAPSGSIATVRALLARAVSSVELLSALRGVILLWAEMHGVPFYSAPVKEVKKRATGYGNCDKASMVKAANTFFSVSLDEEKFDSMGHDNIADACFICLLAVESISKGLSEFTQVYPAEKPNDSPS